MMIVKKGFRFRIKAGPLLEQKFRQFAGCTRLVWNKTLYFQQQLLKEGEKRLSYNDTSALLPSLKEDLPFLKDAPAQSLQQKLKDLDLAFKRAGNPKLDAKRPKFKRRGERDSFRYPQDFKLEGNRAFLPKIGWVRFYRSRRIEGTPKNVTIKRQGDHWFISVQTEKEIEQPIHPSNSMVGIDMGVVRFATVSDGRVFEPLNSFRRLEEELAKEQRKLSRKEKHSSNFKKQKRRVGRIHRTIANARNDYLHKASTELSRAHGVIALEDLKVSNMSASAKGTVEDPGKNVNVKSGLNKSILDQGWFQFRRQLEYKQLWRGGRVVLVDPKNTSRQCPECGHTAKDNRKSQAVFACEQCGFSGNADDIASLNIKAVGQTVLACESSSVGSRKQEPGGDREEFPPAADAA